jgi:hypothetical protein
MHQLSLDVVGCVAIIMSQHLAIIMSQHLARFRLLLY